MGKMTSSELILWVDNNQLLAAIAILIISVILLVVTRLFIGRGLTYLASRTATQYDDLILKFLHPYRISWIAPLVFIYTIAYLFPEYQSAIETITLFGIMWLVAFTINSLLDAANQIYESRPGFTGVSIQSYFDILKIVIILVTIILSISLFTGKSPLVLLAGMGAIMAVLLLVFRDTILALVASVQITTNNLIKEGDWIEVPGYDADGDVININLHTIRVRNFDNTISIIPTYKIVETSYKNWRGIEEVGGRRIKRSLYIDLMSINFCDREMLERLMKIDLVHEYVKNQLSTIDQFLNEKGDLVDSPLDGPQVTNMSVFRAYIQAYLRHHPDLHQEKLVLLVRELAPGQTGLPVEIYAFTKTVDWIKYESIQADIFDHLLAAASHFDLRVFQDPTGNDFAAIRHEE
jgi:miniconductance mechanosensitive channel